MHDDYAKARKLGLKQVRRDIANGRYPYPPALDDLLKGSGSQGEVHVGLLDVDTDLVAGTRTRGRQSMFSRGFMPLGEPGSEFAAKWIALYDSQLEEGVREPIKVFEYQQRFYVQEGNKRVSVAHCLGSPTIPAEVSRVVPMATDERAWALYNAFSKFYGVCPVYGIAVSSPDAYERLADLAGRSLDAPWPDDDVAALRAARKRFAAAFRKNGGYDLDLELGDAFIAFLRTCGYAGALALTSAQTEELVKSSWADLIRAVSVTQAVPVRLEEPGANRPALGQGIASLAKGLASPRPFNVAFIYDEDAQTSGWVALHEAGRLGLEARLGGTVHTRAYPECGSDAAFDEAVRDAASMPADLVISVQPTQMAQTMRAAAAHPEIRFLNCSALARGAVRTFSCRMYEAKYLLGMVAGAFSANHRVGYVAESPVMGTLAEINAFALGVAATDPFAEVHLAWIGAHGYDWRRDLVQKAQVSVVSGRDNPDPVDPRRPWGLFAVTDDGAVVDLGHPVWNWSRYYELMIRSIKGSAWAREGRENKQQGLNYWWGMSSGVIDVFLSNEVPYGVRKVVACARQAIMSHQLEPFSGELCSQTGVVQLAGALRLDADKIVRMNWLAQNVVGSIPGSDELVAQCKEQVKVAGIGEKALAVPARRTVPGPCAPAGEGDAR